MKNIKFLIMVGMLVMNMLVSSISAFASTQIIENIFTGEGYITHEDQEVDGLSFNMFFENEGMTYVRVSGEDSNIDAWRSRTSGRFISDSEMDSIMNPEPIIEEAPVVVEEAPVVKTSAPVVKAPTVQQPQTTDYVEIKSLPASNVTKIIKNVYTGAGYITHRDQEVDGLTFDMYLEFDGFTYVYVNGQESKVEAWRIRTNGTYVKEDAIDEAELLGGKVLETSVIVEDEVIAEEIEEIIFEEVIEYNSVELTLTPSVKSLELEWSTPANTNGLVGYYIYRKSTSDTYEYPMSDFPINDNSFTDKKADIDVDYSYIVEAVFKDTKGSKSNEVSGRIIAKKAITLKINDDKIKVNGKERKIDNTQATPIIIEGRTMVPIRAIVEELDGSISWDAKDRKIMLGVNGKIVEMIIDESEFIVNGEVKNFDVPPMILNGRTLIPLRFVAESLGCDVEWDGVTKTVILYN